MPDSHDLADDGSHGNDWHHYGTPCFLRDEHLRASGWQEEIPLVIEGMQARKHFSEIVINGSMELDVGKCARRS